MPCSNAAKAWNPLKFAGVPQTRREEKKKKKDRTNDRMKI